MCRCIAVVSQGLVAATVALKETFPGSFYMLVRLWFKGLTSCFLKPHGNADSSTQLDAATQSSMLACRVFLALSPSIVAEPRGEFVPSRKFRRALWMRKCHPKTTVLKALSSKWVKTSNFGGKTCHLAKLKVRHAALACMLPLGLVITVLKTWLTGPPVPWPS